MPSLFCSWTDPQPCPVLTWPKWTRQKVGADSLVRETGNKWHTAYSKKQHTRGKGGSEEKRIRYRKEVPYSKWQWDVKGIPRLPADKTMECTGAGLSVQKQPLSLQRSSHPGSRPKRHFLRGWGGPLPDQSIHGSCHPPCWCWIPLVSHFQGSEVHHTVFKDLTLFSYFLH